MSRDFLPVRLSDNIDEIIDQLSMSAETRKDEWKDTNASIWEHGYARALDDFNNRLREDPAFKVLRDDLLEDDECYHLVDDNHPAHMCDESGNKVMLADIPNVVFIGGVKFEKSPL